MIYFKVVLKFCNTEYIYHSRPEESYWTDKNYMVVPIEISRKLNASLSNKNYWRKESSKRKKLLNKNFYSIKEASELTNINYTTLWTWAQKKTIKSSKQYKHRDKPKILIPKDEIKKLIDQNACAIDGWPTIHDFDGVNKSNLLFWCQRGKIYAKKDINNRWHIAPWEIKNIERKLTYDSIVINDEKYIPLTKASEMTRFTYQTWYAWIREGLSHIRINNRIYVPEALVYNYIDLYSITEFAEKINVSAQTISRWIDTGLLNSVKTPRGSRYIPKQELNEFKYLR